MNKQVELELDKINGLISESNTSVFYEGIADVKNYILELEDRIESMKCCGNCGNARTMSQVIKLSELDKCKSCLNESEWVEE